MTTIEELKNEIKELKKQIEEYEAVDAYILKINGSKKIDDIMDSICRQGKVGEDGKWRKWTKEEEFEDSCAHAERIAWTEMRGHGD